MLRLIAAAGFLTAATMAQAQPADWANALSTLQERREGALSTLRPWRRRSTTAVLKSFEKKYGITAELLDVRASELRERIRTEQSTNRFIGDVLQGGAATTLRQQREGQLQPHGGLPNLASLRRPFKADDFQVPSYVLAYGILVNTAQIKPADEPKSWTDLPDAKWKGKILSDDMRALGGGQVMFHAIHDNIGGDFHEKLALNSPIFSRDVGNDERRSRAANIRCGFPSSSPTIR